MKKSLILLTSLVMPLIASCSCVNDEEKNSFNEDGTFDAPIDTIIDVEDNPDINFDKNSLLVKYKEGVSISKDDESRLGIKEIKPISGTKWYVASLEEGRKSNKEIKKFRKSNLFELVDYDYIYGKGDTSEAIDSSLDQSNIFDSINLEKAYEYMDENGSTRGGSSEVIVAVLDTGVDINHIDLRDNIWTNANETSNGSDDDSNGYIDDIHGWNFVGDNSNVNDDNGHGTHVAGIIASEKNDYGTTGIAYNCKIMPLKCGNSSGFFNNSWIAAAISYAASNGADVINMSFGGSQAMSLAVEDALKDAYTTSFLVASAGNDSSPNQPYGGFLDVPNYPACYPYVFGVMSANTNHMESWFTNWDPYPNNKIEYNLYAPGESYPSTFPNNKYSSLNGTSMACPVVAGVAGLIRSMHPSKEDYPTKFISSQLANTSEIGVTPTICSRLESHKYLDAYASLSKASKPNVRLYDFYTFDDESISSANNGNNIIDSGETIQIGMELENVGGKAYQVQAVLDTKRLSSDVSDPYVTVFKDSIEFDEIGVYSIKDTGLKYAEDGTTVVGTSNCFEVLISSDCPDNYMITFNLHITYLDEEGKSYSYDDEFYISVTNRILLKGRIDSDVVLPKNTSYILLSTLTITETGSLTIEEGVDIQMYNDTSTSYYGTIMNSPKIVNHGTLNINGVDGNYVRIHNSELYRDYVSYLSVFSKNTNIEYLDAENMCIESSSSDDLTFEVKNSKFVFRHYDVYANHMLYLNGGVDESELTAFSSNVILTNSTIYYFNCFDFHTYASLNWCSVSDYNCEYLYFQNGIYGCTVFTVSNSQIKFNWRVQGFDQCTFICLDSKSDVAPFYFYSGASNFTIKNYTLVNITEESFKAMCHDKYTGDNDYTISFTNDDTIDTSALPPYIASLKLFDSNGEETKRIGRETFTVKIEFNTDMDTSMDLKVRFGSVEPYAEYSISGKYVDKRHWEGEYTLTSRIEGGTQHFSIYNGRSDAYHNLELVNMGYIYTFNIDTAGSLAMSLQGVPTDDGINLSWMQDDYETIMGYNVYRRDSSDGQDIKINPTLISKDDNTYLDNDVEPGKTYWYSFTCVLSDLSEGKPSSLIQATAKDTIPPVIRHTPVNQGYTGNNLIISCVARDNVSIKEAKLYYRIKGTTSYSVIPMIKNNDTYVGSINGSFVTLDGIEYYIEVSDGTNLISKGSASNPYSVIIKSSSVLTKLGDVDGDGIINSKDALMLQQHLEGTIKLRDDEFKRGDINGNSKIDAKEIMWILQYINGNITSFDGLN